MAGGQAASGNKLTCTVSATANDAFVALMKTIRSDIVEALQFVDQQHPLLAKADSTAKAVAWLSKNKDKLLQVIHNLATPENTVPTESCGPTYALPSTDWRWLFADYSRRERCDQVAR